MRCTELVNENDVIIVTSLVLRTQVASVVFCPPLFIHNSPSVKQYCELRENEQVQQLRNISELSV